MDGLGEVLDGKLEVLFGGVVLLNPNRAGLSYM